MTSSAAATLPGVDVSNHQGSIDWHAAFAAGVRFGLAKAGEGTGFSDRFFPANLAGMRDAGVLAGAYQFARPDAADPEPDGQHFLDVLAAAGGLRPGEPAVIDVEVAANATALRRLMATTPGGALAEAEQVVRGWVREQRFAELLGPTVTLPGTGLTAAATTLRAPGLEPMTTLQWVQRWVTYVEARLGFRPMLYSGRWFMDPHQLTGDPELAQCGLWLAAYGATWPPTPPVWPFVACWQNSDAGSYAGISGQVDTDIFNGDADGFRGYGAAASPAPAPTKPQMTDHDRLALCGYIAGGSGPTDIASYVAQFSD